MHVQQTELMKAILADPVAKKQLLAALVDETKTIEFAGRIYKLEQLAPQPGT